jgi:hypothetical protein
MRDIVRRVRETGLHKVAAPLYGFNDLSLKNAVQHLSTEMLKQHRKYASISSGLEAYASLTDDKTASLKNVWGALNRPLGRASAVESTAAGAIQKTPSLSSQLEPMSRVVQNYGTGGLAMPMTAQQEMGHNVAGMVRRTAPEIEKGNALANKLRTSYAPPAPDNSVAARAGRATADLTSRFMRPPTQ